MPRIFEARYKKNGVTVAHQHATEHYAKIDAKQLSKEFGRVLLGEVDYEKNNLIRVCEFAGGVQDKWKNRSEGVAPCKILLTVEDTKQTEPTGIEVKQKPELSEEEKAERKAALAAIREAQESRGRKTSSRKAAEPVSDKAEKLKSRGYDPRLVDIICKSNVHIDSPNFEALMKLWRGPVLATDYENMSEKDLSNTMTRLRSLLISNETGKSIVTKKSGKQILYRLVDYQLELIEEDA